MVEFCKCNFRPAVAISKFEFEMAKSSKPCVVSSSLLARVNNIDTTKKVPEEFKLWMSDWTDSNSEKENDNFQPPKRYMKVPASKGSCILLRWCLQSSWRLFRTDLSPKNTEKNTK